jgi:hypothetical protein
MTTETVPSAPITPGVQSQVHDPSSPATTTFQEDLVTAGQRRVNLIWEYTQSFISVMVVVFTMCAAIVAMIYKVEIPNIIAAAFGMITGFYFSRTNHSAIGGVGIKPIEKYLGR